MCCDGICLYKLFLFTQSTHIETSTNPVNLFTTSSFFPRLHSLRVEYSYARWMDVKRIDNTFSFL